MDLGPTESSSTEASAIFRISSSTSISDHSGETDAPVLLPPRSRSPVTHQRSISLVDSHPISLTLPEANGENQRPRGMSLPHHSENTGRQRRRGMSFFHIGSPENSLNTLYSHLQHLPVPTFTISSTGGDLGGRKFSFGLRRLSQTTLNRSDSMISLSYRSLVSYIADDNILGLRNYLDTKKSQIDDRDENNSTALIYATTEGKLVFVRELLRFGADVNAEDGDSWTALLCAAKEGHFEICRELLDHGAAVDHRDMGNWSALLWAAYKGRTAVAELLMERGADVNVHENYHISPLHWSCGRGYVEITRMLLNRGAKVNVGDKYGTTPLIWACRRGCVESVEMLLKFGANVDASGMYSWTPLLVATAGNHLEVVTLLLEHKPNVNALDKDGCTALAIACKDGYNEIAQALLLVPGVYVNLQDKSGDSNLIHAVKGGHKGIVEALLKKYADIDTPGKDRKTAVYTAVEKGNVGIVKLLLNANPDLEVATKDGDTPLLRAVRARNAEIVQLLLDKKAKVSVTDKKGDTALHIAMRARSKGIVEILLRNPKNGHLLYRPNKSGETAYNIDNHHQRTILGQIFGKLNTNEENENLLGYDLYSSALADILSEPSLSMPITVGLFAKWGSGKSFLLNKLREEMKNFARRWVDPSLQLSGFLFSIVLHIAVPVGIVLGILTYWIFGVLAAVLIVLLIYTFLFMIWCCSKRYDWTWPYQASVSLAKHLNNFRLVLQVVFCNPPGYRYEKDSLSQPFRFNFTEHAHISNTAGGEHYITQILGSLYDSIEEDYGKFATRLYRAFRPIAQKSNSSWRWRKTCCLPYIVIFELWLICVFIEISLVAYFYLPSSDGKSPVVNDMTLYVLIIFFGCLIVVTCVANIYTVTNVMMALFFSQRKHLQRAIAKLDVLKSEGFLPVLKKEVSLMTDMIRCLDGFTQQQTRLVFIVDGLDSYEQDKVLVILDAVHMLADVNTPFIIVLAIDPHIIAKAVELNSRRSVSESNINGFEYLRNMVHLPFFLANSALRRVKIAQSVSRRTNLAPTDSTEETMIQVPQLSNRRLSVESNYASSVEKLKFTSRKSSRKLKISESVASSIGSNLNRICGAQDLTKMLLTDDYFSDVNPRSMRRLLNVIYVTGRLLKAFQMDFNWYHLALWLNITEQWPYRCSYLILYYEMNEERLDDSTSLKYIYDEVKPLVPVNRELEPLLDVDRDDKKFDVFLNYHRSTLQLSTMKMFLPFTINLDPYYKKIIKEDMQEDRWNTRVNPRNKVVWPSGSNVKPMERRPLPRFPPPVVPEPISEVWPNAAWISHTTQPVPLQPPLLTTSSLPLELMDSKLSSKSVEAVCEMISKIADISSEGIKKYRELVKANNITGRVLVHCDLADLKNVLQMNFGDWELFKLIILALREFELLEEPYRNVRLAAKEHRKSISEEEKDKGKLVSTPTVVENQVALEDEMICGALTTLNEEACEDVLEEATVGLDSSKTVVYLQSPSSQIPEESPIVPRKQRPMSLNVLEKSPVVLVTPAISYDEKQSGEQCYGEKTPLVEQEEDRMWRNSRKGSTCSDFSVSDVLDRVNSGSVTFLKVNSPVLVRQEELSPDSIYDFDANETSV